MDTDDLASRLREHQGVPRLLTPLPRRVRLRLRAHRQLTDVGVWLMDRGHFRLTVALWRVCGMYR